MKYWITDWAELRKDEVIQIPQDYIIHPDFLKQISIDDFKNAFLQVHSLFKQVYGDIAHLPEEFGMPLHDKDSYRMFSQQWRDSGNAPYRPIELIYYLLISCEIQEQAMRVSFDLFKKVNKVKNIKFLFKKLEDYGFHFIGLKNYSFNHEDLFISYPDNFNILYVLKMMADKSYHTNRLDDFLCCYFRLFQDDLYTSNYGYGATDVADRVQTENEKEFIYKMDAALMSMGMYRKPYGGFECHGLAYYNSKKAMNTKAPYLFRMVSRGSDIVNSITEKEKLLLMLRIRDLNKCMEYLKICPESVKSLFRFSDSGCSNRPCKSGVAYTFEDISYWRCGCCSPAFKFKPKINDIPHYIKLVELGVHR